MLTLNSNVRFVKGIGQQRAEALGKLGIYTVRDLINWFPRSYEDRSTIQMIADIEDGASACVHAQIISTPTLSRIRDNMILLRFRIADDSGAATVTLFNQPYLKNTLICGKFYSFYGQFKRFGSSVDLSGPNMEPIEKAGTITGRIVPVYPLSSGLTQKALSLSIAAALAAVGDEVTELLPREIIQKRALISETEAYRGIHFPETMDAAMAARHRLIYEELFTLAVALGFLKGQSKQETLCRMKATDLTEFYQTLPYLLTAGQLQAIDDAMRDLTSGVRMNRLVQGDVGSGKTMVAAACIWAVIKSGYQAAFMAPTELLAEQHYETLSKLFAPFSICVRLLKGSTKASEKRLIREQLQDGTIDLLIGTHAILSDPVTFRNLGLAVTDEQHRFGVMQRAALESKGEHPHILVMSATPIPRTLALMMYGDMDISLIKELPPGRQQVDTYAVSESYRPRIRKFAQKLIAEGRQVYVVCPMIEENTETAAELNSVRRLFSELEQAMPEVRMALLHGKMKAAEKDEIMTGFSTGTIDLLVSTTVVEVGVDVPNAALIVIENAERFGLSQLHQLRGRVGRGKHKSYCILMQGNHDAETSERLRIIAGTHDGYEIAEEDLKRRGPGDFFGKRQSGLPEMKLAELADSLDLLKEAQKDAEELLKKDSALLSVPTLKDRINEVFSQRVST